MPARCFLIHPADNVATLMEDVSAGAMVEVFGAAQERAHVVATEAIGRGHKIALMACQPGDPIRKFGARIGHASQPIAPGAWVHLHNLASDLDQRSGSLDLHTGAPSDTRSAYV